MANQTKPPLLIFKPQSFQTKTKKQKRVKGKTKAHSEPQLVDISKLGLNSKIKKFSYSFICGKGYSPPLRGENSFCLQIRRDVPAFPKGRLTFFCCCCFHLCDKKFFLPLFRRKDQHPGDNIRRKRNALNPPLLNREGRTPPFLSAPPPPPSAPLSKHGAGGIHQLVAGLDRAKSSYYPASFAFFPFF